LVKPLAMRISRSTIQIEGPHGHRRDRRWLRIHSRQLQSANSACSEGTVRRCAGLPWAACCSAVPAAGSSYPVHPRSTTRNLRRR
jgi:hypothetical protein